MPRNFILLAIALLSACAPAPASQTETAQKLDHKYAGRPANEFFYNYGLPVGEFDQPAGVKTYRWVSIDAPYEGLRSPSSPAYRAPNGSYQMVDTYTGIVKPQYCELRVYVDENDVIDKFAVAVDSMGKYTASRCGEIFWTPSLL